MSGVSETAPSSTSSHSKMTSEHDGRPNQKPSHAGNGASATDKGGTVPTSINSLATNSSLPLRSASPQPASTTATGNENLTTAGQVEGDPNMFITQRGGKNIQNKLLLNFVKDEVDVMVEGKRSLQSTLLLQKKKEMQQVQKLLEKKRIEFRKRMDECFEKQEELKNKQRQIRERVLKFEKFLKDNDAKRQRANAKASLEKKLGEQKDLEIDQLQCQVTSEREKSSRIKKMLIRYKIYEKFLDRTVEILPTDYMDVNEPHINDILMRHKTLRETNQDLMTTVQYYAEEIETQQVTLAELIKQKNDEVLVYNSLLGSNQKKLDKLKLDTAYLEQKLFERDNTGKLRHRIISETKMAIDNIYNRVGIRNLQVDASLPEKLHAIQERILDLIHIASKSEAYMISQAIAAGQLPPGTTTLPTNLPEPSGATQGPTNTTAGANALFGMGNAGNGGGPLGGNGAPLNPSSGNAAATMTNAANGAAQATSSGLAAALQLLGGAGNGGLQYPVATQAFDGPGGGGGPTYARRRTKQRPPTSGKQADDPSDALAASNSVRSSIVNVTRGHSATPAHDLAY